MWSSADISKWKSKWKSQPLVMATAYDFPFARILEEAGVDVILVGDSAANVLLGMPSTRSIGMEAMEVFVGAVVQGAPKTHVVADMPFGSDATPELALANAHRFRNLGAHSVKLEGPKLEVVKALREHGIAVMGHLGVTPQTAVSFRRVGKSDASRETLLADAKALQVAGICGLVLENVEAETAGLITESLTIPTIGIGSGKKVNGQVQVLHDLLGLSEKPPPFATAFGSLRLGALAAARAYVDAVRKG